VGAEETAASRRHRALHRQAKYLALSTPASQAKPRAASGRTGPRPSPRLNTSGDARGGVNRRLPGSKLFLSNHDPGTTSLIGCKISRHRKEIGRASCRERV